jgi:hypothetical protein
MTKVVNIYHKVPYDVYIGRPSKWGNPFLIGKDGTREEVLEKYREWIIKQRDLMDALPEIRGKTLACYCSPKGCHGDILADLADNYLTGSEWFEQTVKHGCVIVNTKAIAKIDFV